MEVGVELAYFAHVFQILDAGFRLDVRSEAKLGLYRTKDGAVVARFPTTEDLVGDTAATSQTKALRRFLRNPYGSLRDLGLGRCAPENFGCSFSAASPPSLALRHALVPLLVVIKEFGTRTILCVLRPGSANPRSRVSLHGRALLAVIVSRLRRAFGFRSPAKGLLP